MERDLLSLIIAVSSKGRARCDVWMSCAHYKSIKLQTTRAK